MTLGCADWAWVSEEGNTQNGGRSSCIVSCSCDEIEDTDPKDSRLSFRPVCQVGARASLLVSLNRWLGMPNKFIHSFKRKISSHCCCCCCCCCYCCCCFFCFFVFFAS